VIASEDRRAGEVFRDVEPEDLLKYGLIPEFLGRLPVPPTDSKGIGTVSVKYDPATRMMSWMANYSGLTGNATGAYFHGPASITQNAEVAVPVNGNLTGPIEGAATLNTTEAADLMSGNWYFNIYTADHKGGEMRGQVLKGM
jgi:hypothetical protein